MSWQAVQSVIKHSRATSAPLQCVLLVIAEAAKPDGSASIRSYATIAKSAKLSTRQTIRAIAELQRLGALQVESRGDWNRSGLKRCNSYRVLMAEPKEPDSASVSADISASDLAPFVGSDAGVTSDADVIGVVSPVSLPYDVGDTTPLSPVSYVPPNTSQSPPDPVRALRTRPSKPRRPAADRGVLSGEVVADDFRLLTLYAELWRHRHGVDADVVYGRDRKLLQGLLSRHSVSDVEAALREYFNTRDRYVIEATHPLRLFVSQFGKFHAAASRPAVFASLSPTGQANLSSLRAFAARHQATAASGGGA